MILLCRCPLPHYPVSDCPLSKCLTAPLSSARLPHSRIVHCTIVLCTVAQVSITPVSIVTLSDCPLSLLCHGCTGLRRRGLQARVRLAHLRVSDAFRGMIGASVRHAGRDDR
jgi:hypothetical protein